MRMEILTMLRALRYCHLRKMTVLDRDINSHVSVDLNVLPRTLCPQRHCRRLLERKTTPAVPLLASFAESPCAACRIPARHLCTTCNGGGMSRGRSYGNAGG